MRQVYRGHHGLVSDPNLVMRFQLGGHSAQHVHSLGFVGLVDVYQLEAARQRRVFLDVLLVLCPGGRANRAQHPTGQCWFEQVGRIARASLAARTDQGVHFVDEEHDRSGAGLHFVQQRAKPVLEFALHAGARLQQANVHRAQLDAA